MSKKVLVAVNCASDYADDRPYSFAVEISDELKSRIIELSEIVKKANAYSIDEFNYSGTWSNEMLDEYELEGDIDQVFTALSENESRVECNLLDVTDDSFKWTSVPKHCGDDMLLTTKQIPISFLTGNEEIYKDS